MRLMVERINNADSDDEDAGADQIGGADDANVPSRNINDDNRRGIANGDEGEAKISKLDDAGTGGCASAENDVTMQDATDEGRRECRYPSEGERECKAAISGEEDNVDRDVDDVEDVIRRKRTESRIQKKAPAKGRGKAASGRPTPHSKAKGKALDACKTIRKAEGGSKGKSVKTTKTAKVKEVALKEGQKAKKCTTGGSVKEGEANDQALKTLAKAKKTAKPSSSTARCANEEAKPKVSPQKPKEAKEAVTKAKKPANRAGGKQLVRTGAKTAPASSDKAANKAGTSPAQAKGLKPRKVIGKGKETGDTASKTTPRKSTEKASVGIMASGAAKKLGAKSVSPARVAKTAKSKTTRQVGTKTPTKGKGAKVTKSKKQNNPEGSEDEDEDFGGEEPETMEDTSDDSEEEESEVLQTPKSAIVGNVACSSRDVNVQAMLDHAVQQLGRYFVVNYSGDSELMLHAYIVGKNTKRGWGVLRALTSGVPLVSEDWLSKSISQGEWADMNAFRCERFGQSPRSVSGGDYSQILDGMRVKVLCEGVEYANVRKLVTACGGRVAETRMDVVINDGKKAVEGVTNVSKKWLADSIEARTVLSCDDYVLLN